MSLRSTSPGRTTGRTNSRLIARVAVGGVAASLLLSGASVARPAAPTGSASGRVERAAPGPIHAGNTYGWYGRGGLVWREEFVTPLHRWRSEGPGVVRIQHGMLTLNTARRGTVSATLDRPGRSFGRWETRMRSRAYGHGASAYRVTAELVPVSRTGQACGGQNIGFAKYKPLGHKVSFYVRTRPDHLFQASTRRGLGNDQWHTFAVEVTPKRISWFVDSHVVSTERNKTAMSGIKYRVRYSMQARPGRAMNKSRMQMDWLRYWSLKAPNQRSTEAPAPHKTTYPQYCPSDLSMRPGHRGH